MRGAVGWAVAALLGWAMHGALAAEPVTNSPGCPSGQIAAAAKCVTLEEAAARVETLVREAMVKHDLKAVLAGVAIDGQPLFVKAWGELMTGVPATPGMHFRNGSVAIAYIGIVLLQLRDKGVLSLDDKLSKWFPEYPKADQITLYHADQRDLRLCRLRPGRCFFRLSTPIRSGSGIRMN